MTGLGLMAAPPGQGQANAWLQMVPLVVIFAICLIVALAFPGLPVTHAWVGLFSTAPMTSVRVWMEGIVFSVAFGWIAAAVLGLMYNRLIER